MGNLARALEALTSIDSSTLRYSVASICLTLVVTVGVVAFVVIRLIAKAKTFRFGKGEVEVKFHDVRPKR